MSLYQFDALYRDKGYPALAGVDEAGRGPWAGPVVAAAVVLPPSLRLPGLNDSKKCTERTRDTLFDVIMEQALAVGVSVVSHQTIDDLNILQATYTGMRNALEQIAGQYQLVLVDGWAIPGLKSPQQGIVGGDGKSASIAAASIIAKVTRDRLMKDYANRYPHYGFEKHKGYGSAEHRNALEIHGPCEIHRRSYAPVKECMALWTQKTPDHP